MRTKRDITRFSGRICFILLLCSFLDINAQSNKKITKLWESVESALNENNTDKLIANCKNFIAKAPWDDKHTFQTHLLLADQYLTGTDMSDIYEQLYYLRRYYKKHPEENRCKEYIDELQKAYDYLLQQDLQNEIQEGIYFSDTFNKSDEPLIALKIRRAQSGYTAEILAPCGYAEVMGMYKLSGSPSNKTNTISDIIQSTDDEKKVFSSFWGNERLKQANTAMASSMIEEGEKFRADSYAQMRKSRMNVGETVVATAATEIVGGLFDALGGLFATQKVTAQSVGLIWTIEKPGILNAKTHYVIETQKSGNSPSLKEKHQSMRLYKLYPHYELLFSTLYGSFTYRDEFGNKNMRATNVAYQCAEENGQKNLNNTFMYKKFAIEQVFKPYLEEASNYILVPPYSDLHPESNEDGMLCLFDDNKKSKKDFSFAAVHFHDGRIKIAEIKGGQVNGTCLAFRPDGSKSIITYVNGIINGRYITHDKDGKIIFDGNYANDKIEGYGVKTYIDGTNYKGMWENNERSGDGILENPDGSLFNGIFKHDKIWQGKGTVIYMDTILSGTVIDGKFNGQCKIIYPNGDIYEGEVIDNKPNGHGRLTEKISGKIIEALWHDGKSEEIIKDNNKSKKVINSKPAIIRKKNLYTKKSRIKR